jgi:Reverse transcriptase (RNA-dependent DNA polymerase)
MPDEDVEALEQAADDDHIILSPITPLEATPPPQQPLPAPRKLKPMLLARPEPLRRSAWIARQSQAGQSAPTEMAIPNTLCVHTQKAIFSRQADDSANESFATAPEEPSYAEMAFHVEIDTTMAAAAHKANGNPRSFSEAQSRSNWPEWQQAMECEIEMLERVGTWKTVPHPEGKNIVGSKWVFRLKHKADGSVDKYKAQLIAHSFTQIYGVDYFDTFSPIAKLTSIRTILVIAV